MPDWTLVDRPQVLAVLEEYDRLGAREFLRRHGFRRSTSYTLWQRGQEYDAPAVLGAAYLQATGRPATWAEVRSHAEDAARTLTDLGFDVVAEEQPVAPKRPARQVTATPTRKRASEPAAVQLCPSCHVAVPASGVCDFCD
jgi:hypothetical protein